MYRLLLIILLSPLTALADELTLFANGDLSTWEYQAFGRIKETIYQLTLDEDCDCQAMVANSHDSASGYVLKQKIDLKATPWLHFFWRVDAVESNQEEKKRAGDDFAWRLYFVEKNGLRYRALNVVYSQTAAIGQSWDSPYGGWLHDIRLYALVAHDEARTGVWRLSSVNVNEIWQQLFGTAANIDLVGLMTDSDSTGTVMRTRYGALILSDSPTTSFWRYDS